MPTSTLTANSTGAYTQWTVAAGSRPSLINSDDDDTSYIKIAVDLQRDSYGLTALPNVIASISRVEISGMLARTTGGSPNGRFFMRSSGGTDGSLSSLFSISSGTYALKQETDFGRPGGGSWGPGDFDVADDYEMGVYSDGIGAGDTKCSFMYTEVDWSHVTGGFMWLLGMWIPPFMAVASHAVSFREIARFFSDFKTRPNCGREFEIIQRELLRRPVYA